MADASCKSLFLLPLHHSRVHLMNNNTKPKIVNPYAKKKSVVPPPTSIAPSNANASSTGAHPSATNNSAKQSSHKDPVQRPPPPVDVDPSSTFSQAFGDYEPDANFDEHERSEQLKFDEALVSESTANPSDSTTTAVPEFTARDHHAFLQPNMLHVSTRQRGNPVLNHIRNVPYQLSQMVPDYIFAPTRCALFLSIRYHNLHPQYIHRRIAELKSDFDLRVLLCHVDIDDNANVLLFLNDLCVQNNLTLILAWSEEEAARYLETFKAFDGKDASLIQKREHTNYIDQMSHVLGSVRSVNKTDSSQLLAQFGTWRNLVGASVEELSVCPGVGVKKVRRLYEAFRRPFSKEGAKRRKEREREAENTKNALNNEKKNELENLQHIDESHDESGNGAELDNDPNQQFESV
jgi:DNA excision repair protein ERCC-1